MTQPPTALRDERDLADMAPNFLRWTENAMLEAGFAIEVGDPRIASLARAVQQGVEAERADLAALREQLAAARAALYAEIGKHLTDALVADQMRYAGIPLHGRPIGLDLQAREVGARMRRAAMEAVDAALAASSQPEEPAP